MIKFTFNQQNYIQVLYWASDVLKKQNRMRFNIEQIQYLKDCMDMLECDPNANYVLINDYLYKL